MGRASSFGQAGAAARAARVALSGKRSASAATQFGAAFAGQRAGANGADYTRLVAFDARRKPRRVDLVEHADLRHEVGADLRQHRVHRGDLLVAVGMARVDDVEQEVGVGRLGERRAKRGDEIVRQVADEAHGIGQHDRVGAGHVGAAQRGVERGEQLVGGVGLGAGEPVEQRRLAGVGVADERHRADRRLPPRLALRCPLPGDAREAFLERLDADAEQAPVRFELRLAGAAQPDAALLPLEVRPAADEPRQLVLDLRELDLELAFGAARAQREDVEDEAHTVDDAALELRLEVALLRAGERVVEDDEVRAGRRAQRRDLLDLALAREQRGVGALAAAGDRPHDRRAGGRGERVDLRHPLDRIAVAEIERDEQRADRRRKGAQTCGSAARRSTGTGVMLPAAASIAIARDQEERVLIRLPGLRLARDAASRPRVPVRPWRSRACTPSA